MQKLIMIALLLEVAIINVTILCFVAKKVQKNPMVFAYAFQFIKNPCCNVVFTEGPHTAIQFPKETTDILSHLYRSLVVSGIGRYSDLKYLYIEKG